LRTGVGGVADFEVADHDPRFEYLGPGVAVQALAVCCVELFWTPETD
jgi:hypothetical protein